jgi:hypothetical protein
MPPITNREVVKYVRENIAAFHDKRLESINKIKLEQILKRKNPYLFKAKNILAAPDLVKTLLDAHLSSQEETIFGDFLEGLAIHINKIVFNGNKSEGEGIDLKFDAEGITYIVSIKSGPNWGNSSQINKMKDNFNKAKRILRTSNSKMNIIAVNGCCYGVDNQPDKGEYLKLCGQRFWQFISGDESLFTQIIEPLGHEARERNKEFSELYAQIVTKFTCGFAERFCNDGKIDWERLVRFNSGIKL